MVAPDRGPIDIGSLYDPLMPTDADKEVQRLAHLVDAHLGHVSDQLGQEVEATAGSPFVLEQANSETGPAGKWGDVPVHTAMSLASLKLTAALDHIASLYKQLQLPHTLYGLAVMARASVEASAKGVLAARSGSVGSRPCRPVTGGAAV